MDENLLTFLYLLLVSLALLLPYLIARATRSWEKKFYQQVEDLIKKEDREWKDYLK
jgi:hypothetical protein